MKDEEMYALIAWILFAPHLDKRFAWFVGVFYVILSVAGLKNWGWI